MGRGRDRAYRSPLNKSGPDPNLRENRSKSVTMRFILKIAVTLGRYDAVTISDCQIPFHMSNSEKIKFVLDI